MSARYERVKDTERRDAPSRRASMDDEDTALARSFDPESESEDDADDDTRSRQSPVFVPAGITNAQIPSSRASDRPPLHVNDGVFANIQAKEDPHEKVEEHPPSYEAAAADAAPPYWETTIIAAGLTGDEVLVDGLPVGNVFAFIWNLLISMAFQFVGFLLTYLLHTTHAAKHGSRAGLGITLIQYGFYIRTPPPSLPEIPSDSDPSPFDIAGNPDDIQDPSLPDSMANNAWLSYILLVSGWFLLIKSLCDFIRARRMEQVVLSTPSQGLTEGEAEEPAHAV